MRRGFTLLEMLVVLGIIALLAAIMLPAWQIVSARAKSAKCLSNLRQQGFALESYLADHGNTMPTLVASRANVTDNVLTIDNTLNAYTTDPRIFTCPADLDVAAKTGTSYYWDSALNGQNIGSLNLMHLISGVSGIPVLVDKSPWHHFTKQQVNTLYADGHATTGISFLAN